MRNAKTILGIIRERGKKKLPLEKLYRQLYNRNLYLLAYNNLYKNKGALTPGSTNETIDGMSIEKIDNLIAIISKERYQWTPTRRIYIPKKDRKKKRPLGLPSWSDKLLQEVIRLLLEAYYEPQFSLYAHGFRPNRGCHTALREIKYWTGTTWFIEGDISQCFDKLDHKIMLSILSENVLDQRFLRLINNLLKAGYLEDWKYRKTHSGSPQGGVASPLLSNIYLDKLDTFVETNLLSKYNKGEIRQVNQKYSILMQKSRRRKAKRKFDEAKQLRQEAQKLPSKDPNDPNYRRLRYVRYADDWLLGFSGPKSEAEEIKDKITTFLLKELKLELSQKKTLITHARTQAARFLGYDIVTQHNDTKQYRPTKRRSVNGTIGLRVPTDIIQEKLSGYMKGNQPVYLAQRIKDSDFSIIAEYQAEYRGIVQYYKLANNICHLNRLYYIMETSLAKTLASKHKSTVTKICKKFRGAIRTPFGKMKVLQTIVNRGKEKKPLTARFGGIPLRREPSAIINDNINIVYSNRSELLSRLLADICELCGTTGKCEVHHIRKLSDMNKSKRKQKPQWAIIMAARRRKTLIVCRSCHCKIHNGEPINSYSDTR